MFGKVSGSKTEVFGFSRATYPAPPKGVNKENQYFYLFFLGYAFREKLGLDSILASLDLKIRIPRRKLRI